MAKAREVRRLSRAYAAYSTNYRLHTAANDNPARYASAALAKIEGCEPGPFMAHSVHLTFLRPLFLTTILIAVVIVDILILSAITSTAMHVVADTTPTWG